MKYMIRLFTPWTSIMESVEPGRAVFTCFTSFCAGFLCLSTLVVHDIDTMANSSAFCVCVWHLIARRAVKQLTWPFDLTFWWQQVASFCLLLLPLDKMPIGVFLLKCISIFVQFFNFVFDTFNCLRYQQTCEIGYKIVSIIWKQAYLNIHIVMLGLK